MSKRPVTTAEAAYAHSVVIARFIVERFGHPTNDRLYHVDVKWAVFDDVAEEPDLRRVLFVFRVSGAHLGEPYIGIHSCDDPDPNSRWQWADETARLASEGNAARLEALIHEIANNFDVMVRTPNMSHYGSYAYQFDTVLEDGDERTPSTEDLDALYAKALRMLGF